MSTVTKFLRKLASRHHSKGPAPSFPSPHSFSCCHCPSTERERGSAVTIPPESFLGIPNTRSEENPETLSFLSTHSSFLGTKRPMTSGNLMPPAQPPNPPGTRRSLHLTSSAQGPGGIIDIVLVILKGGRTFTSCPLSAVATPNRAFSGSHTSACLKSGEESLSDRAIASAIMCRPGKAHAFTVSAQMQGLNSINSLETTGSFF